MAVNIPNRPQSGGDAIPKEKNANQPGASDPLGHFSPAVRLWFRETFGTPTPPQRIGLSATIRPLEETAHFLGAAGVFTVAQVSPEQPDIRLLPISYQMEPIVVTGEEPEERILRKVIEQKKKWRAALKSSQAEAYTRLVPGIQCSAPLLIDFRTAAFRAKYRSSRLGDFVQ